MRAVLLYPGSPGDLKLIETYVHASVGSYYLKGKFFGQELFKEVCNAFTLSINKDYDLVKFGFDIFVKSEQSLVRSLIRDMNVELPFSELSVTKKKQYFDEALDGLKDFYRMNFCIQKNKDFERCSIEILQKLLKIEGVCLKKYINPKKKPYSDTFHNFKNGCKDFKAFLQYRGYPFEIQLHNISSENMNLATHGIYEVYRAPDLKNEYKELLGKDRGKLYELVKSPKFSEDKIVKEGLNYHGQ